MNATIKHTVKSATVALRLVPTWFALMQKPQLNRFAIDSGPGVSNP